MILYNHALQTIWFSFTRILFKENYQINQKQNTLPDLFVVTFSNLLNPSRNKHSIKLEFNLNKLYVKYSNSTIVTIGNVDITVFNVDPKTVTIGNGGI